MQRPLKETWDVLVVGTGVAGLYCALQLPTDKEILIIAKNQAEACNSFLAQGGICVLRNAEDFSSFFNDTMAAGGGENDPEALGVMIEESPRIIENLVRFGVAFQRDEEGNFCYTKEGGHSTSRILYQEDATGAEITGRLLDQVKARDNITLKENTELVDLLVEPSGCRGAVLRTEEGAIKRIDASYVVLATGGIGGLFQHSTNDRCLTGDSIALALRHGIALKDMACIQIHPTTLYGEGPGRCFLISESMRGEGAILLDGKGRRFVNELLPRDQLTRVIRKQMEKDKRPYVMMSAVGLGEDYIKKRFPRITKKCRERGWDLTREPIPVTPAQHYFMGGIAVDLAGATGVPHLYAVGETACTGVHGRNRLASNSLLEALVFAGRAAKHIEENFQEVTGDPLPLDLIRYRDMDAWREENKQLVLEEIERRTENGR